MTGANSPEAWGKRDKVGGGDGITWQEKRGGNQRLKGRWCPLRYEKRKVNRRAIRKEKRLN